MEAINRPHCIIAFSVLLIAAAMTAVLASVVMLLKKIGATADAVGFAVSQTGAVIRKRFSGAATDGEIPPIKKGSVIRGLSVVSAIIGGLIKVARRRK